MGTTSVAMDAARQVWSYSGGKQVWRCGVGVGLVSFVCGVTEGGSGDNQCCTGRGPPGVGRQRRQAGVEVWDCGVEQAPFVWGVRMWRWGPPALCWMRHATFGSAARLFQV